MGKSIVDDKQSLELFQNSPVPKAVLTNAIPAMAASLMMLVYNLADTFFIGQTHNDLQVASVSLATPVFLIFMAFGTVFGIGGTSVISRSLGARNYAYAKKVSSFCMWGCVGTGIILTTCMFLFIDPVLSLIGASPDTWEYTKDYLLIVSLSGVFILVSGCFSSVLRAEGQAVKAVTGQLIGNIINILLDPVMILLLGMGIKGAAIATVIGNFISAGYYIQFFLRGQSMLGVSIREFTAREGVAKGVLAIGVPSAIGSALMSISGIIMNMLIAEYGDMALAAIGVAMKVTMITGTFCIGLGQGVQPILGYCVGARNWDRYQKVFRFSAVFSFALSLALTGVCYLFTKQIVDAFLTDTAALKYGVLFSHILLSTSALFGIFYVIINALQANGAAVESLIINASRQGIVYIPAMIIMEKLLGVTGLIWAQPVADVLSLLLGSILYKWNCSRLMRECTAI